MPMTEERRQVEAPTEANPRGARWWIVAVIGVVALAGGVLIGTLIDDGDEGSSEVASTVLTGEPGSPAAEFAERWGDALESADNESLRALYRSADDGGATIVDRVYRAVWTDADSAIDRIVNNPMEFDSVELVSVEESGQVFAAEYEAEVILPGEGPDYNPDYIPDRVRVVVVFYDLAEGRIGQSDIYFPIFRSFITGEIGGYPQRTDDNATGPRPADWIIID